MSPVAENPAGRTVRAVASESWDEDFLWQHSSTSDLHLPSTNRHSASHTGARVSGKSSTVSTATTASSASSSSKWTAGSSKGSLKEEDEPTITLKTGVPMNRSYTQPAKSSASGAGSASRSGTSSGSARAQGNGRQGQSRAIPIARSRDGGGGRDARSMLATSLNSLSFLGSDDRDNHDDELSSLSSSLHSSTSFATTRHQPSSSYLREAHSSALASPATSRRSQTPSLTSDFGAITTETDLDTEAWDDTIEPSSSFGSEHTSRNTSFSIFGGKSPGRVMLAPFGKAKSTTATNTASSKASLFSVENGNTSAGSSFGLAFRAPFNRNTSSGTSNATSSSGSSSRGYGATHSNSSHEHHPGATVIPFHEHIQHNRTIKARQTSSNAVTEERTPRSSDPADQLKQAGSRLSYDSIFSDRRAGTVGASRGLAGMTVKEGQALDTTGKKQAIPSQWYTADSEGDETSTSEHGQSPMLSQESSMNDGSPSLHRAYSVATASPASSRTQPPTAAQSTLSLATSMQSDCSTTHSQWSFGALVRRKSVASSTVSTTASAVKRKLTKRGKHVKGSPSIPELKPAPSLSPVKSTSGLDLPDVAKRKKGGKVLGRKRASTSASTSAKEHAEIAGDGSMAFAELSESEEVKRQPSVRLRREKSGTRATGRVPFPPSPDQRQAAGLPSGDSSGEVDCSAASFLPPSPSKPQQAKKFRRPLSFTAMLSRAPMYHPVPSVPLTRPEQTSTPPTQGSAQAEAAPSGPAAPQAKPGRRTLHRPAQSTSSIPSVSQLFALNQDGKSRKSISRPTSPSHLLSGQKSPTESTFAKALLSGRRSFNPMRRNSQAIDAIEGDTGAAGQRATGLWRPTSSLSLYSETSTVRPVSLVRAPNTFPNAHHRTDSSVETTSDGCRRANQAGPPSPILRKRHLPSLSLTLLPGVTSSTPPRSAIQTPAVPSPSLSTSTRPYTSSLLHHKTGSGQTSSGQAAGYFGRHQFSTSSNVHLPDGSSPGGVSIKSTASGGEAMANSSSGSMMARRVSLSDLKIPPRISNAQAKIGQDLKRVKEFKEGVEELKNLRKMYRNLVNTDLASEASFATESSAQTLNVSSATGPSEDSGDSTSLAIPVEMASKVDHIFARVALDYKIWWEYADVLINLADGADGEESSAETSAETEAEAVELDETEGESEVEDEGIDRSMRLRNLDAAGTFDSSPASKASRRARCRSMVPARRPPAPVSEGMGTDLGQVSQATLSIFGSSVSTSAATSPEKTAAGRTSATISRSISMLPLSPSNSSTTLNNSIGGQGQTGASSNRGSAQVNERQLEILRGMLKQPQQQSSQERSQRPMTGRSQTGPPPTPPPTYRIADRSKSAAGHKRHSLTPDKRLPSSLSVATSATPPPANTRNGVETAVSGTPGSALARTPVIAPVRDKSSLTVPSSSATARTKKNRFRQVSKAGMLGIRDFLKALKKSTGGVTVISPDEAVAAGMAPSPHGSPAHLISIAEATPQRPSPGRRVVSDSAYTPVRNSTSLMAASLAITSSKGQVQEGKSPDSTGRRSTASTGSSSDEDWDRRSSEDEVSPRSHMGARAGLQRSDTQGTVMPFGMKSNKLFVGDDSFGSLGTPSRPSYQVANSTRGREQQDSPFLAASTSMPGHWTSGTKLVMTTEAMPTLLAYISDVKNKCTQCVTELRNVTV